MGLFGPKNAIFSKTFDFSLVVLIFAFAREGSRKFLRNIVLLKKISRSFGGVIIFSRFSSAIRN